MPRKKNTRAAQGAGNIRKKTVVKNGLPYTYWEARVTIGRDPGTGKQLRRSFSGKTQKEVREKMQAAAVAINDGDYFEPSKMTVGQWLDTMGSGIPEQRQAAHGRELQSEYQATHQARHRRAPPLRADRR